MAKNYGSARRPPSYDMPGKGDQEAIREYFTGKCEDTGFPLGYAELNMAEESAKITVAGEKKKRG